MNEHDLIKAMEDDWDGQHLGAFWRKIHGSKFQAGFPDVVCALPDVAALTEFKWCKDDALLTGPFAHLVVGTLTGLQYAELKTLGAMGETCPLRARVLIGCPVETERGDFEMAFGCDVADVGYYTKFSALDVITVALRAKLFTPMGRGDVTPAQKWVWPLAQFPDGNGPRGLEFQLRRTPSKEQWRVGPLVLGLRRYKVHSVRTVFDPEAHDEMYG